MYLNKNPRLIAVHILTAVLLNNQSLKEEFERKTKSLIKRDIAFVKNLVYGILRFKKSIDRVVRVFYKGRYSKLEEKQKNIFRIGVYQILKMNSVPNYASVNTTVEIAKKESLGFSRVVNAVLLKFINSNKMDKLFNNSPTYDYPLNLINQWGSSYTDTQVADLCDWNSLIPTTWFRCNKKKIKELKVHDDIEIHTHADFDNYICFNNPKYAIDNFVKPGIIDVQSPSSGLIVDLLHISNDDIIIDACAAPGGKTKNIYEKTNSSNKIYANEKNKRRYDNLKRNLKNEKVLLSFKDASKDKFPMANKILLDVPCSSTGTIQKNPDIKWKDINLNKLTSLQFNILKNMSKFLKKDGVIVYSTCSINKEENMEIIDKFLTINDDFMLGDASKYINPTYVDKNGCLSIFPPQFLLEGVFAAILIKK